MITNGILRRNLDERFQKYADVICLKCQERGFECGCIMGQSNPPFKLLKTYALRYEAVTMQARNVELDEQSHRWLVVDFSGGLGNQLIEFVNGLQIALVTGRILVLRVASGEDFKYNTFTVFDSVLELMTTDFLERHDFRFFLDDAWSTFKLDLWSREGIDNLMCSDLGHLQQYETFHMVNPVQDVHLINANPHCEDLLRAFHGLNFFFLSHFLWTGDRQLKLTVHATSSPTPLAWDGERALADLVSDLRASNPVKIVAVHVRVARSFEYLDTYHYPRGWQRCSPRTAPAGNHRDDVANPVDPLDFCYSSSLDSVSTCLLDQLRAWIPGYDPSRKQEPYVGLGRHVIVLWATDHDGYTERLVAGLSSLPAVHVVRIRYGHGDRHDSDALSGMCDMLALGAADEMVATTMSTFSFAAHARSLLTPHYLSYRDPCGGQGVCARANGPEAGLLAFGRMHDGCVFRAVGQEEVRCARQTEGCVSALMDPGWRHDLAAGETIGCLQSAARCLGGDLSALFPYQANISHANQFEHVWAKRGRVLHLEPPRLGPPTCPSIWDQFETIERRYRERYYEESANDDGVHSSDSMVSQYQSSVDCVDNCCTFPHSNRTCKYHNLYFFNGLFYVFTMENDRRFDPSRSEVLNCARCPEKSFVGSRDWVFDSHHKSNVFVPERKGFRTAAEVDEFFQGKPVELRSGTHFLFAHCHDGFEGAIHWNLGHALLDELFPAWYGLLKFGLEDEDFAILVRRARAEYSQNHEIFAAFSGRPLEDMDEWPPDTWIRLETVLAGVGHTGLNSVSRDYRLSGTRRNSLKLFRNRMFARFGIRPSPERRVSSAGRPRRPLRAVLVPNKRGMGDLDGHARAARAKCPGVEASVVDFRESFLWEAQLRIFREADVYVSGIGTGFVGSFLVADGAVAVNLGSHQVYGEGDNATYWRSLGYVRHGVVHFQDEYLSRSVGCSRAVCAC